MGFRIDVNLSQLIAMVDAGASIKDGIERAGEDLAHMVETQLQVLARQKLKSRFELYVDGISTYKLSDTVWVVDLSSKVWWIEDGQRSFSLLDGLLRSKKAKTAKDGSRYVVVPFEHGPGKGPTAKGGASGVANQDLVGEIKAEMARRNKPFGKIETDAGGNALLGKLHSFDINNGPKKTHDGIGQGHGHIGNVRQGVTGIPFLRGVNVYQKAFIDARGERKVRRTILTFRTASSKQQGGGRWEHPGNTPVSLMEDAYEWAREQWENTLAPTLMDTIYASLDP